MVASRAYGADEIYFDTADLEENIRVSFTLAGTEQNMQSTVGRECAFVVHHAFHHAASIQALATNLGYGHACPDGFGIAPSTSDYRAKTRPS